MAAARNTASAQCLGQPRLHGICGGQSDSRTGFSVITSFLTCHYHSTNIQHSASSLTL
jgi:hypothetical protein